MWLHTTITVLTAFSLFCSSAGSGLGQAPGEPSAQVPSPEMTPEQRADAEIGKKAAEEVERQFKLVEESPELPRIGALIDHIRPLTEKPRQSYQFKVIDSKAVNAFALPGGYLYFTQGLLDAVESDDELAAVAAHEMAHVCLDHSRKLMARDKRYKKIFVPVVLAAILTSSEGVDPGAVATVGGLVVQDALNHYGREAEMEADRQAVHYLGKSNAYNPVAMLTVVEGLARLEGSGPPVEMGVFQTHPYAKDRVRAVAKHLQSLGIPLERRRVTHSLVAEGTSVVEGEVEIGELKLNGRIVFRPAVQHDGVSAVERAKRSAEVLNSLLLENLQLVEILLVKQDVTTLVTARGEAIVTVLPGDASFHESDVDGLAQQALAAIQLGFREEKLERAY